MKKQRVCQWCGRHLEKGNQGATCYYCQEKRQEALARHLEVRNIGLTVKEVALKRNMSPGHVRRILGHPQKYPWRYYGIAQADKVGKEWVVFLTPLEHEKELAKQLVNIGEGALNIIKIKALLGLNTMLTLRGMFSLLQCQVTPLPRRKTPWDRREQIERLRRDPGRAVDQLITVLANFVEEIVADDKATAPYSFNRSATP